MGPSQGSSIVGRVTCNGLSWEFMHLLEPWALRRVLSLALRREDFVSVVWGVHHGEAALESNVSSDK